MKYLLCILLLISCSKKPPIEFAKCICNSKHLKLNLLFAHDTGYVANCIDGIGNESLFQIDDYLVYSNKCGIK